jgi:hypothetical protein
MIQHIVLFRWKGGVSADAVKAAVAQIFRLQEIAGVSELVHGENFAKHSDGHAYALTLRLRDDSALKAYWRDPIHQQIMDMMRPILDQALVIDFEL